MEDALDSLIPYDDIVQEALRAVVGRVLGQISDNDMLPGDHHFYITFKTQAPGVEIPRHLIAKFPDEMTIVLQHKFWDLKVLDNAFTVGLTFGGVTSKLMVPFAAITGFVDPAVNFALQFQAHDDGALPAAHDDAGNDEARAGQEDGSNVVAVDFKAKRGVD